MSDVSEGWGYIGLSTKWHYYAEDGVSLCRKFMKMTRHDLEQGNDSSSDNCKKCKQLLAARKAVDS